MKSALKKLRFPIKEVLEKLRFPVGGNNCGALGWSFFAIPLFAIPLFAIFAIPLFAIRCGLFVAAGLHGVLLSTTASLPKRYSPKRLRLTRPPMDAAQFMAKMSWGCCSMRFRQVR